MRLSLSNCLADVLALCGSFYVFVLHYICIILLNFGAFLVEKHSILGN